MKFKLHKGEFKYISNINTAFGLDGFPNTIQGIPVKLKITKVIKDNFWGDIIQVSSIKNKTETSFFSGVQDNDGVLNIITTNFSINSQGIRKPLGTSPGYSLITTIKKLKNEKYQIISIQEPGFISKSIGTFTKSK
jgi:hypothetical protein